MRLDIKKILIKSDASREAKQSFDIYEKSSVIGRRILDSLWKKTVQVDNHFLFYAGDDEEKTGYLTSVCGYVGVLSLANRYRFDLEDDERNRIIDAMKYVLSEVSKRGYTFGPYYIDDPKDKEPLFSRNVPYVGAMTWALSFYLSFRNAVLSDVLKLDESENGTLMKDITKEIKSIITFFITSVIYDENSEPIGWGYTEKCEKASLFFTYSVLEAFSDFDDNVLNITGSIADKTLGKSGERITGITPSYFDEELINELNKNNRFENEIQEEWKKLCFKITDKVWKTYKDVVKDTFVDDSFLTDVKTMSRADVLKANSSNALFNNIFIIFILVYGYLNVRNESQEQEITSTMNIATQFVQTSYEYFVSAGADNIVDTYYLRFKSSHVQKHDKYGRTLNKKNIVDMKLIPMLVKLNSMLAFYVTKYPVKQMGTLFKELFEQIREDDDWTWESDGFDVKITERYIEAIADFYQYYDTYESGYASQLKKNNELAEEIRDKAFRDGEKKTRDKINEEVRSQHAKDIEDVRREYTIENAITDKMTKIVHDEILNSLKHIVDNKAGKLDELSEFEKQIENLLPELMKSYLYRHIRSIAETESDKDKAFIMISESLANDFNMFVINWIEQLKNSTAVLSNVIKGDE